jgi:hypothetical protein
MVRPFSYVMKARTGRRPIAHALLAAESTIRRGGQGWKTMNMSLRSLAAMTLFLVACGSNVSNPASAFEGGTEQAANALPTNVAYSCAFNYQCTGGALMQSQQTVTITPPRERCDPDAINPVRQTVQTACGGQANVASFQVDCAELDVEDGDHCDSRNIAIP